MRRGASQGEHAAQQREHPGALVLVEVDEDLGVTLGAERVPPGLEPVPQRGEVVDLAVEDRPDRAVLVGERLMASLQVNDRQPAKPQRCVVVPIGSRVVRTAVDNPVHHRGQVRAGQGPPRIGPDGSADTAHRSHLASPGVVSRAWVGGDSPSTASGQAGL